MTRVLAGFALLLPLVLLAGCYSKVRPTGFLDGGYQEFNLVDEDHLKMRVDESFLEHHPAVARTLGVPHDPLVSGADGYTTQAVVFIIPEPRWIAPDAYPRDPESTDEILFTIRERIYRYLLRAYPHPVRVRYAYSRHDALTRDYRVITVTANVTDFKKGIGLVRYVLGYFGEARIQIEGEIFEGPGRERKIGEYAIRRASAGYAQSGLNPTVLRSDVVMRYAADEAITDLTQVFPRFVPGVGLVRAD